MKVNNVNVRVYRIPTEQPEADGTIAWDATTMAWVEITADSGHKGMGFTYASLAAADHVPQIIEFEPIGLEGIDDRLISYMRKKELHPSDAQDVWPRVGRSIP